MDGHYEHCDRDEDDERIGLALGLKRSEGVPSLRKLPRPIVAKAPISIVMQWLASESRARRSWFW